MSVKRWTTKRLCLESLEARQLMASLTSPGLDGRELTPDVKFETAEIPRWVGEASIDTPLSLIAGIDRLPHVPSESLLISPTIPRPDVDPPVAPMTPLLPPRLSACHFQVSGLQDALDERDRESSSSTDDNSSQPEQPPELFGSDASFRLGTINFQAFPFSGLNPTLNFISGEERARHLAQRIRESDYDVVVLQEVWDDDVKEVLFNELYSSGAGERSDRFSHVVAKLGNNQLGSVLFDPTGPITDDFLDSGLMLFSKFPFASLPTQGFPTAHSTIATSGEADVSDWSSLLSLERLLNGKNWDQVAFLEFDDEAADFFEGRASKGAGYVRLWHETAQRYYNIVFTHMLTGSFDEVKSANFGDMGLLLDQFGPVSAGQTEEVFIVGDMNVNGDLQERYLDQSLTEHEIAEFNDDAVEREHRFEGRDREYTEMLELLTVRGMTLQDAWTEAQPNEGPYQTDRGTTDPAGIPWDNDAGSSGLAQTIRDMYFDHAIPKESQDREVNNRTEPKRIDYIFYLHPDGWSDDETLGFQQLRLAYNLFYEGQTPSDHLGLTADLNRRVAHGTASDAQEIRESDFDNDESTANLSGWIVQPSGVQWYRLDKGGTYTFGRGDQQSPLIPGEAGLTAPGTGPIQEDDPPPIEFDGAFNLEVYDSRDMSRPLSSYTHIDSESHAYHLADDGIYYIRVWRPDFIGTFSIPVHRHTGALSDFRTLFPNEPMRHTITGDQEHVWFQIDTDAPLVSDGITRIGDNAQTLRFTIDKPQDFTLRLFRERDGVREPVNDLVAGSDGSLEWTHPSSNNSRLFLRVTPTGRLVNGGPADQFTVGWETNLTVVDPLVIGAERLTETDYGAAEAFEWASRIAATSLQPVAAVVLEAFDLFNRDDLKELFAINDDEDLKLTMTVDGTPLFDTIEIEIDKFVGLGGTVDPLLTDARSWTIQVPRNLGDFSEGHHGVINHKSLKRLVPEFANPIAFLDRVDINLTEHDDFLNPNDELHGTISSLPVDKSQSLGHLTHVTESTGIYNFYSNLYHGMHRIGGETTTSVWASQWSQVRPGSEQATAGPGISLRANPNAMNPSLKSFAAIALNAFMLPKSVDDGLIGFRPIPDVTPHIGGIFEPCLLPLNWVPSVDTNQVFETLNVGQNVVSPLERLTSMYGDARDIVVFADTSDWRMAAPQMTDMGFVRTITNTISNEVYSVDLPRPWQNVIQPSDINNDGDVTAGDALRIINELAQRNFSHTSTQVLNPPSVEAWPGIYLDQNGDERVTAIDALRVINQVVRSTARGSVTESSLELIGGNLVIGQQKAPLTNSKVASDAPSQEVVPLGVRSPKLGQAVPNVLRESTFDVKPMKISAEQPKAESNKWAQRVDQLLSNLFSTKD